MKRTQRRNAFKFKLLLVSSFVMVPLILLSGAAFAPPRLNLPAINPSLFELPDAFHEVVQEAALPLTVRKPAPKIRVTQRLNDHYRIRRSLGASV